MTIRQSISERCATVNQVLRVTVLRHNRAVTHYWNVPSAAMNGARLFSQRGNHLCSVRLLGLALKRGRQLRRLDHHFTFPYCRQQRTCSLLFENFYPES
jgi:hypothetical protein